MLRSKGNIICVILLLLIGISFSGLPMAKYAVYSAPIFAILIFAYGKIEFEFDRNVIPFAILAVIGYLSVFDFDFEIFKKVYFLFCYVIIFTLFNYSKVDLDVRYFASFFIALFLATSVLELVKAGGSFEFSILDSKSTFESTFAFPIGMIALYFYLTRKYGWFAIMTLFSVLALKRIVLLALLVTIVIANLPKALRLLALNPFLVALVSLLLISFGINFAQGDYDQLIYTYTGHSSNAFSMGRKEIWGAVLNAVDFQHSNYLIWGDGFGSVTKVLNEALGPDPDLLHNDILVMVLEQGYLLTFFILLLIMNVDNTNGRLLAIFLMILFFSDNVIIYQHVMIPYFILLGALKRAQFAPPKY